MKGFTMMTIRFFKRCYLPVTLFFLFFCLFMASCQQKEMPQQATVWKAPELSEADIAELAAAQDQCIHFRNLCRFFDEYLAEQSKEYIDAVKKIALTQLLHVNDGNRYNRVSSITTIHKPEPGQNGFISYQSKGRSDCGDESIFAMVVRDNKVVGLHFAAETAIDSCPCLYGLTPDFLDDDFMDWIACISTLEYLDLGGGKLTDAGLAKLANLHSLKELTLGGNGQFISQLNVAESQHTITNSVFQHLHGLTALEILDLGNHKYSGNEFTEREKKDSDVLFEALSKYPHLKKLIAPQVELTRKNLTLLTKCQELEDLTLHGTMSEPCLDVLERLPNLKKLFVTVEDCTKSFEISRFPALEEFILRFSHPGMKTQALNVMPVITITNMPELNNLYVGSDDMDYHVTMSDNPKLSNYIISSDTRQGGYPKQSLVSITRIPEAAIRQANADDMASVPQAELALIVWPEFGVHHGSLTPKSKLPETENHITHLEWRKNSSSELLQNILRSSKTKVLHLSNVEITETIFEAIAQMQDLEELSLFQCTLDESVDFSQLTTLEKSTMTPNEDELTH